MCHMVKNASAIQTAMDILYQAITRNNVKWHPKVTFGKSTRFCNVTTYDKTQSNTHQSIVYKAFSFFNVTSVIKGPFNHMVIMI